ncbi:MAG: glutamate 5-kinase [Planctomycetota bacterium]|nr:glutamate 5-kinase [Planctomycetota bacterium]
MQQPEVNAMAEARCDYAATVYHTRMPGHAHAAPVSLPARPLLPAAKRIVVKVGTSLLTGNTTHVDRRFLLKLCAAVAELWAQKREVAIVTSGAIGAGCGMLGYAKRPVTLSERQACASAGQVELMKLYAQAFRRMRPPRAVGQLLLTRDCLTSRDRYLNARNTLVTLFKRGAVPIVNENDTVSIEELRFGDNDMLSALLAGAAGADLLVILTDVPGLMDADPRVNPHARLVPAVEAITPQLEAAARPTGSFLGTGGMASKLQAARIAVTSGFGMVLVGGHDPGVLLDVVAGREVGTYFHPRADRISARKHWLAFAQRPKGLIVVDAGARDALVKRHKSLLPSGVLNAHGTYEAGALVSVVCENREFARGLTNFSAQDINRIRGKRTAQAEKELGELLFEEVVHRDNLVIL